MSFVQIKNGKVELRKDSGSLIRSIGNNDAIDADINQDFTMILVTTVRGKVELRKENGSLIRTIVQRDATGAKFQGENILVSLSNGKNELRKENGSYIKRL